uniref:VPS9 domain-containing protein n=1 Tax=Hyaloperonospora arabidopsidis (strain Emoy2) TaxID=559515 RepID=M4BQD7_HYAAE
MTQKQQHLETASRFVKIMAPVVAAGGVVGAIAIGPSVAVLTGLNLLITSVGAETVMAGIGLTASAAAAATVTHQSKVKAVQRSKEKLRKGEWAMEICWNCMQNFAGAASDDACRKDAEFLRRFQLSRSHCERKQPRREDRINDDDVCTDDVVSSNAERVTSRETVPDDGEVYCFLFSMFASPGELLGQMNVQLCETFRKRFTDRHRKQQRRPSFTGKSSSAGIRGTRALAKDTLQDTKMYVAHVLGATLQCFPSLASTSESVRSCTLAVERIIYDDIHAMVFSEFQSAFKDAETAFAANVAEIRREQSYHSSPLLRLPYPSQGGDTNRKAFQRPVLADDLQKAEAKLLMMQETSSPLLKLVLLCDTFRDICCFAEKLHQSASNTDLLIPILCAFFVECPSVCHAGSNFVAEIAFISFFTNGGGKGVEGYVLTTLQAAIQVIVAVDVVPNGHAKELELFVHDNDSEATDEAEQDDCEFFDAMSTKTQ